MIANTAPKIIARPNDNPKPIVESFVAFSISKPSTTQNEWQFNKRLYFCLSQIFLG